MELTGLQSSRNRGNRRRGPRSGSGASAWGIRNRSRGTAVGAGARGQGQAYSLGVSGTQTGQEGVMEEGGSLGGEPPGEQKTGQDQGRQMKQTIKNNNTHDKNDEQTHKTRARRDKNMMRTLGDDKTVRP
ncbi:hypothetical protein SKAU_G00210830 [Synaphobranchus kaupii]|uniref:Uncharacterized protein n=1 Tax=Synaphobranchus kaupii TaxID=118154 RepID=A0A9Q1F8T9_SYNKA|nr:hypothetical protein SKAU_G00210830 [Synaphobranchus kaupii]